MNIKQGKSWFQEIINTCGNSLYTEMEDRLIDAIWGQLKLCFNTTFRLKNKKQETQVFMLPWKYVVVAVTWFKLLVALFLTFDLRQKFKYLAYKQYEGTFFIFIFVYLQIVLHITFVTWEHLVFVVCTCLLLKCMSFVQRHPNLFK